jgi:hypothetical protein
MLEKTTNTAPVVEIEGIKLRVKSAEHGAQLLMVLADTVEHQLEWHYKEHSVFYTPKGGLRMAFEPDLDLGTPPVDKSQILAEAEELEKRAAELRREAE